MEEWLGAGLGSSRCCSVCGTSECRTVEVEGTTFETIPETLFLRAALVASSQLLSVDSDTQHEASCAALPLRQESECQRRLTSRSGPLYPRGNGAEVVGRIHESRIDLIRQI